jgi:cyclopropane-fatty-acyl-phospholipid synthase
VLSLYLPDDTVIHCGEIKAKDNLNLYIHDETFFYELAHKGGIGLGEAYQLGYWSSNDLTRLLQWLLVNSPFITLKTNAHFTSIVRKTNTLFNTLLHYRNRNTIEQSRENIHIHYDLGNTFYKTFLDSSMTYSSAYFRDPDNSLEEAQSEKYDRLCRKLNLNSTHRVLEIGCGWGGFALHAAKHYGCIITATTISQEQYQETKQRIAAAGLQNHIHVTMTDYRKLEGTYDRIVSIEMLEAVGHKFLGEYFKQIETLLNSNGLAGVQVITCPNPLYEGYRKRVDWIQKHIFPGSHLPSTHALLEKAEVHGNLEAYHMESFGLHYARTLRTWREHFLERWSDIQDQGFDETFRRKWEYYFAYCEAGFIQRHVNVHQLVFGRADETAYRYEMETPIENLQPRELTNQNAS